MFPSTVSKESRYSGFQIFRWLLLSAIIFVSVNCIMYLGCARHPEWPLGPQIEEAEKIDYLFMGTSRVAAAIDPEIFSIQVTHLTGRPVTTLNKALGWSTSAEYYFGLKRLYKQYPHRLDGCVVFLEAYCGLPSAGTWNDPWMKRDYPSVIVPLLALEDLIFLWETKTSFEHKLNISFWWLTKDITVFRRRDTIRVAILQKGRRLIKRIFESRRHREGKLSANDKNEIARGAGIAQDPATIQRIREYAEASSRIMILNQKPIGNWDATVIANLAKLIRSHGGQLVFFRMPGSSVEQIRYSTQIKKNDMALFHEWLKKRGISYIDVKFEIPDEAFPDLWHMRISTAKKLTKEIASEYVLKVSKNPPGQ